MTTKQVRKLLWDSWDKFSAGQISGKECEALTKAANKRLRAIKKELRTADQLTIHELIGD